MKIRTFLLTLAAVALPGIAQAQVPTDMTATGTVSTIMNVAVSRALDFGTVSTTGTTVALADATSGIFSLDGNTDASVSVTMPTELAHTTVAGATIPLTGAACGISNLADGTGITTHTCGTAQAIGYADLLDSEYVYVGATATASASSPAGSYEGTITLTTTYTTF